MLTFAGGAAGGGGAADVAGPASSTDNAAARFDSTTGKIIQNSDFVIGDVAGGVLPLSSTAGNSITFGATAPAAAAGASVAGKTVSLFASNAVASTDTAGAAAGGAFTITAGNAARLTSGNADGGAVNLTPGAGIGTGVTGNVIVTAGQLVVPVGSLALPSLAFSGSLGTGIRFNNGAFCFVDGGAEQAALDEFNRGIKLPSTGAYGWGNNATPSGTDVDTKAYRVAAGVVGISASGDTTLARTGWLQWAGESLLAADGTNATATMANTGLSVTVTTGRKYGFKCLLYVNDSVAAEGAKIDFDGGTATATNFRAHATLFDSALNLSAQVSALATDIASATVTGDAMIEVHGTFEPSATGTFIPRYAQNTHAAGTLTIYRGSHLLVWDMP